MFSLADMQSVVIDKGAIEAVRSGFVAMAINQHQNHFRIFKLASC